MLEGMLELNTSTSTAAQVPPANVRARERARSAEHSCTLFMLEAGLFVKPSRAMNAGMDRGSFGGGRDKGADGAKEARGDGQVRAGTLFRPYQPHTCKHWGLAAGRRIRTVASATPPWGKQAPKEIRCARLRHVTHRCAHRQASEELGGVRATRSRAHRQSEGRRRARSFAARGQPQLGAARTSPRDSTSTAATAGSGAGSGHGGSLPDGGAHGATARAGR